MELPEITVDFYKSCLNKFLEEDKHDEKWTELLQQRKQWAEGLLSISPVYDQFYGYALCYETRYHLVLLDENILQTMTIVPDRAAEFAAYWLMQKHCWMTDFQENVNCNYIVEGIQTQNSNPHVEFFRQRWRVKFAKFLTTTTVASPGSITVPNEVHYKNRRSFVILYGSGNESNEFPLQFETHLVSLIELLNPECSNPKLVEILCKQVTNEVSVISQETQERGWHLDVVLCNRCRELFLIRPQIVNSVVNQHIQNLLNMKNEEAGRDLAARFAMAIKQIIPGVNTSSLPADLDQQYQDFIRSGIN